MQLFQNATRNLFFTGKTTIASAIAVGLARRRGLPVHLSTTLSPAKQRLDLPVYQIIHPA